MDDGAHVEPATLARDAVIDKVEHVQQAEGEMPTPAVEAEGPTAGPGADQTVVDQVRRTVPASQPPHADFGHLAEQHIVEDRDGGFVAQDGIEHELRAVLRADGAAWGYLVLVRPPELPDFSPAEAAFVAAVAPHLAEAQQTDQLAAALADPRAARAPGLLLLGEADEVLGTTREADDLLEELGQGACDGQRLPEVIYLVAAAARGAAQGTLQSGVVPRGRLRTPSGQWLVVHGSVLRPPAGGSQVAISIEPAQTSEMAALLVKAYEFTEREQQVVLLVLQGLSTDEIARRLCVSSYTVHDHLKAIFDKAGVRSRRDLVAEVFYCHQRVAAGT